MKISDIEISPNTIVLGVFDTNMFRVMTVKGCIHYGTFCQWCNDETIIDTVIFACHKCDKIIFILDKITFPINTEKSVTCEELQLVCSIDKLFNKTVFLKGENVINFDKNIVLS